MLITLIIGFVLLLAAIFAGRAVLGYRAVRVEAAADHAYKREQGMRDADYDAGSYIAAYTKVHAPRGSAYVAMILAANAVLTVPILGLLSFLLEYGWRLGGQDRAFEPGYLVWQFLLFGGLIIGWAFVTYLGARYYYGTMPAGLSSELKKQAAKAL